MVDTPDPPLVEPPPAVRALGRFGRPGAWMRAHPGTVTVIGSLIVAAALVIGLWNKREDFVEAFGSASFQVLSAAVGMKSAVTTAMRTPTKEIRI